MKPWSENRLYLLLTHPLTLYVMLFPTLGLWVLVHLWLVNKARKEVDE